MLPIVVVVIASLNSGAYLKFPPEGLSLRWYGEFFRNEPFLHAMYVSLQVATISAVCSTVIGTLAALYYVKFALRRRAGAADGADRADAAAGDPDRDRAAALLLHHRMGTKTLAGLQIGHILVTMPYVFLNVTATLGNMDPSLEEAARSLGATPTIAFRRISLPLMKQGVSTARCSPSSSRSTPSRSRCC